MYQPVARARHEVGVFGMGSEPGSGSVVQERYEGRLTTARERMSTEQIERSGYTSEHTKSVSEVGEKKS